MYCFNDDINDDKQFSISFFKCYYARFHWIIVYNTFGLYRPNNVFHVFSSWLRGVNKKLTADPGWAASLQLYMLVCMALFETTLWLYLVELLKSASTAKKTEPANSNR